MQRITADSGADSLHDGAGGVPWLDSELANLERLPATLNRAKSDRFGERQLALAKRFRDAGLLSDAELAAVQARFKPAGREKFQLEGQ